jgi:hypothetical protein
VRRLAFEDQTLLVASLRQIVDQKEEGAPKRIGTVERETRMAAIRVELAGIMISDENEPSHALLEKACQIFETNTLRYLEPAVCTSRSQEVQGGTKTKELAFQGWVVDCEGQGRQARCTNLKRVAILECHDQERCFNEVCSPHDL